MTNGAKVVATRMMLQCILTEILSFETVEDRGRLNLESSRSCRESAAYQLPPVFGRSPFSVALSRLSVQSTQLSIATCHWVEMSALQSMSSSKPQEILLQLKSCTCPSIVLDNGINEALSTS